MLSANQELLADEIKNLYFLFWCECGIKTSIFTHFETQPKKLILSSSLKHSLQSNLVGVALEVEAHKPQNHEKHSKQQSRFYNRLSSPSSYCIHMIFFHVERISLLVLRKMRICTFAALVMLCNFEEARKAIKRRPETFHSPSCSEGKFLFWISNFHRNRKNFHEKIS